MADISNPKLAPEGVSRIEWALEEMPVIRHLMKEVAAQRPLRDLRISGCLHITTETANLARTLKAAGAEVVLCASNPLSTQDDVAAALVEQYEIPVHAIRGESKEQYYRHINSALDHAPHITMDDGADLISQMHSHRPELLANIIGGTEETTTGVIRLRAMAKAEALRMPVIAVNDAMTKHFFDNRYGTGQSALDGILRATNILLAGKTFTVVGYGWCGRGVAMRARGHGCHVIVAEVDPLRALEASLDGYEVMPLVEAAKRSDFMLTVSGNKHVIDAAHFAVMKDHCVLANAGHFNVEINIPALERLAVKRHQPRQHVEEFELGDGRRLRLLAEGRLVNLAAAEGHPSAVMDMSFANQVLCAIHLANSRGQLTRQVLPVPAEIDSRVAKLKLQAMNIEIDRLTEEQFEYLNSWQEGT